MKVSYQPLFNLLVSKKILPKQLIEDGVITESDMIGIAKGEYLPLEVQEKICSYLECNVYEILRYPNDEEEKRA
jgi:DNA-binding Xre family transcriptional regulator